MNSHPKLAHDYVIVGSPVWQHNIIGYAKSSHVQKQPAFRTDCSAGDSLKTIHKTLKLANRKPTKS